MDAVVPPDQDNVTETLAVLKQRFGERFSAAQIVREQHANTVTWHGNEPPDGVVFAQSTQEVSEVVKICAARKVPVIAFGTGTSLEGHVNAPAGGVCIDLMGMNNVVAVHAEDLDCIVQAGVTRKQINEHLRDTGLFFPIDPGADASLGGMAATRASGTNAVRYGTMRDNVIALTAVMPDGEIIHTGRRSKKSSAGYDLTRLLIGSEGTLGIITELTLKLYGIPEAISAGVCPFETIEGACNAVIESIQFGLPVARIELLDPLQMKASNAYSKTDYPEMPTLLLEFHGTGNSVKEQAETFGEIARANGGRDFIWATKVEDRNKLWQARHDAYLADLNMRPGAKGFSTDVCLPISRLAECVNETLQDIADMQLIAPIVGHVGDGNFHVCVLVDMEDSDEISRAKSFVSRLNDRAITMEGTCTGEHGVGQGKMAYMDAEHGHGLAVMRAVKRAIDPDNIMNPGKIFAFNEV